MADNARNYIGIAMGLDVTELKQGLQETRKEIQTANKRFKAETSGLDDWTKSADGLSAKLTQLDTVLKNQRKNIAGIEAELAKAKDKYGENSEQVRKLTDQLLDATAAVGKTEKAIRKYNTSLEKLDSETKEASDASHKLSDAFDDAKSASDNLKGGFSTLKVALGNLIATGISSFISGLSNAVAESQEFRRELSYLEQGAETAGVSFDKAKQKVKEVYAVFGEEDSAVEGLNNLMTAGFDGAALDTITEQLTGAAIQWKDTLKFEGLADGLQETLATGKAIGPFVELLERGGIIAEDFDAGLAACTTTAEKQAYVMETLSSLGLEGITQGYKEANKSLIENAEAQFQYNQSMSEVAKRVEPVFTTIKQGWADVLTAAVGSSEGMNLEALRANIQSAFAWFIDTVIPAIKSSVDFVIQNKDTILATVTGLGAAFAAWKVTTILQGATAAMKALWVATEGQTVAQKLLNLAMKANPIGLIVSLIAGLVTAFITLWNTSDEFRGFWLGLWNKIKAAVEPVISFLGEAFSKTWDKIKKVWSVVADWFKGIWNQIKSVFSPNNVKSGISTPFDKAWKAIKIIWDVATGYFKLIWSNIKSVFSVVKSVLTGDFRGAWNGIKDIWDNSKSYFSGIIEKIFGYFGDLPDKLISIGRDMIDGLVNGIWDSAYKVVDAAKELGRKAVNAFENVFDINSPSKVMHDEIGMMIGAGIGEGILDSSKVVNKDIEKFTNSLDTDLDTELAVPIEEPNCNALYKPVVTAWHMIKQTWDEATLYFANIWSNIDKTFSVVESALSGYFYSTFNSIKSIWDSAIPYFKTITNSLCESFSHLAKEFKSEVSEVLKILESELKRIIEVIDSEISRVIDETIEGRIVKSMNNITSAVRSAIAAIKEFNALQLEQLKADFKPTISGKVDGVTVGQGISEGIITGVEESFGGITGAIKDFGNSLVNGVKDFFGIHSPSRLMRDEVGKMLGEGVSVGLLSSLNNVNKDISRFVVGLQADMSKINSGLSIPTVENMGTVNAGRVVNNNYTQNIYAPKTPSRLELYMQTKNLLAMRGGY